MLDTIIIGAGPAGLTTAIYLARFHRPHLVIDADSSRARWIPQSHNMLGFPQGIGGSKLLSQLRTHAEQYGARICHETLEKITRCDNGFVLQLTSSTYRSRFVVLATGVQDHLPALPRVEAALLRSVLRVCPICDAYEATGKRIAVISDGERGEREADFLKTYSNSITLVHIGASDDPERRDRVAANGIALIEAGWESLDIANDPLRVHLPSVEIQTFDVCYAALGCSPRIGLATALGAACDENGQLVVSSHCETSIPGLYAVGDVVRGLNQVVVAAAEGAIAATHIHNRLRAAP